MSVLRIVAVAMLALVTRVASASGRQECMASGPRITMAARIGISAEGGGSHDNWTDYLVTGRRSDAQGVCQGLVAQELKARLPDGLVKTVLRRCRPEPLPAAAGKPRGARALVEETPGYGLPLLLVSGDPCAAERAGRTSIVRRQTMVTKSRAACRRALSVRRQQIAAEAQRSAQAATRWLKSQVTRQKTRAEAACNVAAVTASRCREVRQQTERATCQIELARAKRSCAVERRMLRDLQRRVGGAGKKTRPRVSVRCAAL